jgi:hypothetical protein
LKLIFLWGVPVVSFIATVIAVVESASANENAKLQAQTFSDATNRLAVAEAKQAPRRISEDQRKRLIECLGTGPKGKVRIAASITDVEATEFAESIEDILTNLAFEVYRPAFGTNGVVPSDAYLTIGNPGLHIAVKDPQKAPRYAGHIHKCFNECGLRMKAIADPDLVSNRVEIVVGPKL